MSKPGKPREVSRLRLANGQAPHWIALAPDGERIMVSGGHSSLETRVLLARDPAEPRLLADERTVVVSTFAARVAIDDRSHDRASVAKATGGSRNGAGSLGLFVQTAAASRWNPLPYEFVRLPEDPG